MFSDCRNLIALKPENLRWIVATKCASNETVQSHQVAMTGTRCLTFVWGSRAAGTSSTDNSDTSSVPKWYAAAMIDVYMTSPSVYLWKTVQHRQDYWLMKFRTQYNTKTGPQTDDVWRILWRQREREAVTTDFLHMQPNSYATPEWWWFWHANYSVYA